MLLCFLHPATTLLVKNAVDLFAHGYSPAKAALLPLFLLAALVVDGSKLPTPPDRVSKLFAVNAVLAHLLALTEQLWFARRFGLDLWEPGMVLKDGYFTVSSLHHIHVSKVLLAPLFGELKRSTDAGYPLEQIFGTQLAALHLLLFAPLLVLALCCSVRSYRTLDAGRATSLTLAVFAIVKTGIDGGPLSSELLCALSVLAWLHWGVRSAAGTLLALALHLIFVETTPLVMLLWGYPTNLLALSLPALWERWFTTKSLRRIWYAPTLALALFFSPLAVARTMPAFSAQPYGLNLLSYGLAEFAPGTRLWLVATEKAELPPTVLLERELSVGPYRQFQVMTTQRVSVLELCTEMDLPISREPVVWRPDPTVLSGEIRELDGPRELREVSALAGAWEVHPAAEGYSKVRCRLQPGCNRDIAYALLGPRLMILRRGGLFKSS